MSEQPREPKPREFDWGWVRDLALLCGVCLLSYGVWALWGREVASIVLGSMLVIGMIALWWRSGRQNRHGPA